MIQYFPIVTGSLTVLGNINVSGSITTSGSITISGSITSASFASTASYWSGSITNASSASFASTASFVANAESASYVLTAQTASFIENAQTASYVLNAVSSSFASTASFVANAESASNAVSAVTASFANNLTVAGTLTAQTIVVQTITSSVDFVTGSTRFGSILGNTHVFSGSVTMNPGGLFVSSSGIVGIGTNSPSRLLTLKNSSDGVNGISFQSYAAASENAYIRFDQSDDTLRISNKQNYATGGTIFYTNDTEKMRITSAGNVGIGTSNPGQILHISGSSIRPQIEGSGNGGYSSLRFVGKNSGGTSRTFEIGLNITADDVWQITNGSSAFVNVNTSGNVGIGTTSTVGKLDINTGGNSNVVISNDSTDTGYNIVSLNGSRTKGIYAGIAGGGTGDGSLYLNSGADIVLQTGASFNQRMRTVNDFTLAGSAGGTGGPTRVIGTTSMCGILFVSIGTQNCAAIFIINAATPPVLVSQTSVETRFSITYNSGNTANVYVSGTNIELQNNIQATRAFYCQFFGKLS